MSEIRVDSIKNQAGTGAPSFPSGLSVTGVVTATSFVGDGSGLTNLPGGGGGLSNIVEDTTPQLGGNLDLNGSDITGTGDVNITGIVTATSYDGAWAGSGIGTAYGGTGISTYTSGDILYASATDTLSKLPIGLAGQVLTISAGFPSWQTSSGGGGSGSGLGLFNTAINGAVGYTITTSLLAGFTAPATAGYKYIIHSIQVTNITPSTSASLNADISGTNYSGGIELAYTMPFDPGVSIELIKRPKVLNPSDVIRFSASSSGVLHVTITYQTTTTTNYFGSGIDLTTINATNLYSASADSSVESILLVNTDGTSDVKATVTWTNSGGSIQGYYVSNLVIPADSSVEILEAPKFIANTNLVKVQANVANRLAAIISGITA